MKLKWQIGNCWSGHEWFILNLEKNTEFPEWFWGIWRNAPVDTFSYKPMVFLRAWLKG